MAPRETKIIPLPSVGTLVLSWEKTDPAPSEVEVQRWSVEAACAILRRKNSPAIVAAHVTDLRERIDDPFMH